MDFVRVGYFIPLNGPLNGHPPSLYYMYLYYHYHYVGVRKRQVAILARSSREMSLTVRIVWQYILSRVRVSIRPSNFFIRENYAKPRGKRVATRVFISTSRVPVEGKSSVCVICMKYRVIFYYHQSVSDSIIVYCKHLTHARTNGCTHAHSCARACASACVHACVFFVCNIR